MKDQKRVSFRSKYMQHPVTKFGADRLFCGPCTKPWTHFSVAFSGKNRIDEEEEIQEKTFLNFILP